MISGLQSKNSRFLQGLEIISSPKKFQEKGFTLLEMCIVIFIIVLFLGISVPSLSSILAEQRLKEPAQQLQLFAKTARRQAVDEQHLFQIVLSDKEYQLNSITTDPKTGKNKVVPVLNYKIPAGITFKVQRWNLQTLKKPENEQWFFQPSGILEPIHVRFQNNKSWEEFSFHPLTANVQDETSHFES
jgi:prepilin-type N-terminal cleavage/methylation domain-containing protein